MWAYLNSVKDEVNEDTDGLWLALSGYARLIAARFAAEAAGAGPAWRYLRTPEKVMSKAKKLLTGTRVTLYWTTPEGIFDPAKEIVGASR